MQVVLESRRECREAQKLLGMIKTAFPEVLTAIKTKQLAQEILLNKEEHIGEVEKTGGVMQPNQPPLSPYHSEVVLCNAELAWFVFEGTCNTYTVASAIDQPWPICRSLELRCRLHAMAYMEGLM